MAPNAQRAKEIYKPIFVARGSRIAAAAQNSYAISLYWYMALHSLPVYQCLITSLFSTETGKTVSRGQTDYVPHTLAYSTLGQLAASERGSLDLLTPQWEESKQ